MNESLPPDLDEFIKEAVARGEYITEDDVVIAAVRTLRQLTEHHAALCADIQQGIDAIDARLGKPWDSDAMIAELQRNLDASQSAA